MLDRFTFNRLCYVLILSCRFVVVNGSFFVDVYVIFRELAHLYVGSDAPCYLRNRVQPAEEACESIVIPNGFCETCGINTEVRSDGEYENCLYTSGVETFDGVVNKACLDKIQTYINMNPCDEQRAQGLMDYRKSLSWPKWRRQFRWTGSARQIMDSFVYGICEMPCDCIPQFNASITERALQYDRGNCQGHAEYDVCRMFPNVKLIRGENGTTPAALNTNLSTLDPVCPILKQWRRDHPGTWFDLTPTVVHPVAGNFLEALTEASEMLTSANDSLWRQCFYLESQQSKIVPI